MPTGQQQTAPNPPTNLRVWLLSSTAASILFNAPTSGPRPHFYQQATSPSGPWTINIGGTQANFSGLTPGTAQTIYIRSARRGTPLLTSTPVRLDFSSLSPGTVAPARLAFPNTRILEAADRVIIHFVVVAGGEPSTWEYRRGTSGAWTAISVFTPADGGSVALTLSSFAVGSNTVQFRASNPAGSAVGSAVFTRPGVVPTVPGQPSVSVSMVGSSTARLTITPSTAGDPATSYEYYLGRQGIGWPQRGTPTTSTIVDLTGLLPDTGYMVRAEALNAAGRSAVSAAVLFRTTVIQRDAPPEAPVVTEIFDPPDPNRPGELLGRIAFLWTLPPTGDYFEYELASGRTDIDWSGRARRERPSSWPPAAGFYVAFSAFGRLRVRACNSAGCSAWVVSNPIVAEESIEEAAAAIGRSNVRMVAAAAEGRTDVRARRLPAGSPKGLKRYLNQVAQGRRANLRPPTGLSPDARRALNRSFRG